MESMFTLGMVFRVVDRFTGPVRKMGALLGALRGKLRDLGGPLRDWGKRALIAGGIATAAALAPAHAYGNFQAELAAVGQMTHATAAEMRQLERTAIQLGIKTEHSPQAAIEAFRALSAQGLTLQQQFKAIRPTLQLATAGQIGLADAATTTASALNAFGIKAGQTQRVVDILMKATTLSALRADDYQRALGQIGPLAQATNQRFEDMVALLGTMRSQGITAESAAEKIRVSLQVLQAPTAEAAKLLRKLGIQTRDTQGRMLPFTRIVDNIQARLAGMDQATQDQIVSTIFGRDAMQAYQSAAQAAFTDRSGTIHRGTEALRAMSSELQHSEGAAKGFSQAFLATFKGKWQLLTGSLSTLSIVFGKFLAEALKPFVIWATNAVNAVIAWVLANPRAAKELAKLAVIVAGATLGLGVLLTGLWGVVTVVGVLLAPVQLLAGAITFLLSPVGLAVIAIGALFAGMYLLGKNAEAVSGWVNNLTERIRGGLLRMLGYLLDKIAAVAEALPSWALPKGLQPEALRKMADSLRQIAKPKIVPVSWKLPTINEVLNDFGLGHVANLVKGEIGKAQAGLQSVGLMPNVGAIREALPSLGGSGRAAPHIPEMIARHPTQVNINFRDTHIQNQGDVDTLISGLTDLLGGLVTAEQP